MADPRRSSRISNASSSPPRDRTAPKAGKKRKAESVASPRANPSKKQQKTLEETMPEVEKNDAPKDLEMKDAAAKTEVKKTPTDEVEKNVTKDVVQGDFEKDVPNAPESKTKSKEQNDTHENGENTADVHEAGEESEARNSAQHDEKKSSKNENDVREESSNGNLAVKSPEREKQVPSNIIEKGIIYFFTRGRVGIEDPESVQDLQRTYFVMRPIPTGAKLGDGAIDDTKQNRLVALPKKVFPKSGKDRFMAFIEKSKASMEQLKEEFFKGTEYETQTMGTRHTNPITPIGEGVYAITEIGNTTHLAYILTIPEKPEQVQDDLGLREKGSFIISLKNPTRKGPANATLSEKPDYPQEYIDDFRGLAWMPIHKADYLNYPNAQLLLIGEGQDKFDGAVGKSEKDKNDDKETPEEELEKLEDEDQIRIEHLHGEDSVFDDLHISKKDYPALRTTW